MKTKQTRRLSHWLALSPALCVLACAFLTHASTARRVAYAPARTRRAPAAQEQSKPKPEPMPTVYGRVVYDDTSRPVRRARIMLVSDEGARTDFNALTDAHGDFRIEGVRAGSYFAFVDVPGVLSPVGFVSVSELRGGGVPDFGEARKFFDIVEVAGKEDVRVIVHARRGAVLGGKVSYADGDPAVNVTINLMRRGPDGRLAKYLSGANLVSLSELRTDDRGMFRITGLPPGEYFVGVSESVDHGDGSGGRGRSDDISGMVEGLMGQQLLMTFYPSANSPKDSSVVKVEAGDERGDIDVTIPERELRTVAGVVRGRRDRQPVANARVTIFRKEDAATATGREAVSLTSGELSQNATTTDADGHWQFREIPDGPYTVFVRPPEEYENVDVEATRDENTTITNANVTIENMNGAIDGAPYPRRKKKGYAPARREVEVTGDVSEIEVEVSDGGHVSGTITVEGGRPPRYGYVNVLRVAEGTAEPDGMDTKSATTYGGRFSVEGLPAGKFFIQPSAYDEDGQLYVKSITWNGKNLMHEPLEMGEGANANGIEIVYSRSPATLRVRTTREGGKGIAPNVNVFLMQADASDRTPYAHQLFCSSGSDGFCSINAPPGEYAVIAVPRSAARGSVVDELLRRRAAAPRVSLRAGETKAFEVSVPEK